MFSSFSSTADKAPAAPSAPVPALVGGGLKISEFVQSGYSFFKVLSKKSTGIYDLQRFGPEIVINLDEKTIQSHPDPEQEDETTYTTFRTTRGLYINDHSFPYLQRLSNIPFQLPDHEDWGTFLSAAELPGLEGAEAIETLLRDETKTFANQIKETVYVQGFPHDKKMWFQDVFVPLKFCILRDDVLNKYCFTA